MCSTTHFTRADFHMETLYSGEVFGHPAITQVSGTHDGCRHDKATCVQCKAKSSRKHIRCISLASDLECCGSRVHHYLS